MSHINATGTMIYLCGIKLPTRIRSRNCGWFAEHRDMGMFVEELYGKINSVYIDTLYIQYIQKINIA